ncbi:MAG: hypothetical protein U1F87_12100 [Kiritimatiellia bacterium]
MKNNHMIHLQGAVLLLGLSMAGCARTWNQSAEQIHLKIPKDMICFQCEDPCAEGFPRMFYSITYKNSHSGPACYTPIDTNLKFIVGDPDQLCIKMYAAAASGELICVGGPFGTVSNGAFWFDIPSRLSKMVTIPLLADHSIGDHYDLVLWVMTDDGRYVRYSERNRMDTDHPNFGDFIFQNQMYVVEYKELGGDRSVFRYFDRTDATFTLTENKMVRTHDAKPNAGPPR